LRRTPPVRGIPTRERKRDEERGRQLSWCRSQRECEIDPQQFLEECGDDSNLSDGVARRGDDAGRKVQPLVAETTDGFLLPRGAEVVTLEQLHEREGEHADGEVETVGGELTARKMIQSIVMFEFADHFLELTTLVVEVHDRLGIFLLVGDIRGDDPVMVVALEEVILVATFGTFCYEAKGIRATLQGVNGLGNLIVGFGAIIKIPLCPSMVRDSGESVHHRRVVPARRPVRRSIPAKANVRRFACLREADASLPPRASLQRDGPAKAGHAGVFSWHLFYILLNSYVSTLRWNIRLIRRRGKDFFDSIETNVERSVGGRVDTVEEFLGAFGIHIVNENLLFPAIDAEDKPLLTHGGDFKNVIQRTGDRSVVVCHEGISCACRVERSVDSSAATLWMGAEQTNPRQTNAEGVVLALTIA